MCSFHQLTAQEHELYIEEITIWIEIKEVVKGLNHVIQTGRVINWQGNRLTIKSLYLTVGINFSIQWQSMAPLLTMPQVLKCAFITDIEMINARYMLANPIAPV